MGMNLPSIRKTFKIMAIKKGLFYVHGSLPPLGGSRKQKNLHERKAVVLQLWGGVPEF